MASSYRNILFRAFILENGEKLKAVKFFEKLDDTYKNDKNKDPKFRPAYELLIEYYKEKNNKKKHLEYINKLMALDDSGEKIINTYFQKFIKNMIPISLFKKRMIYKILSKCINILQLL